MSMAHISRIEVNCARHGLVGECSTVADGRDEWRMRTVRRDPCPEGLVLVGSLNDELVQLGANDVCRISVHIVNATSICLRVPYKRAGVIQAMRNWLRNRLYRDRGGVRPCEK